MFTISPDETTVTVVCGPGQLHLNIMVATWLQMAALITTVIYILLFA